jgi:O-antigen ligase
LRTAQTVRLPRAALVALQIGAIVVVLAALPFRAFELDRFFVPKELTLHLAAAVAGGLALAAARDGAWRRWRLADWALAGFLALGALSALLAENRWLAARSLAISVSAAAVFWTARALARSGRSRPLVLALATAVTIGAATSLLQAYGMDSDYFSINRAPGGTFGNRNFVAHIAAIGLPLVVYCALTARRSIGALASAIALGIVAAALVLSRSRAAWLAIAAGLVPPLLAILRARSLNAPSLHAARRRLVVLAGAVGVLTALLLPNSLRWKSDSPYMDSVKGVVDYRQGSGAGRLVQYENTLQMALDHPALGVGPGNWPVWYPRYASRRDPSLGEDGMTSNPWPSSDWAAHLAERGIAATILLALVLVAAALNAVRALLSARTADETLLPAALGSVLVATLVVGAFDAVLLLAAPALLVWASIGALWPEPPPSRSGSGATGATRERPRRLAVAFVVIALLFAARSASQAVAMSFADEGASHASIARAATADPGSYRLQIWLARGDERRGRCKDLRIHARAALALFPSAAEPRRLLAGCGVTVPRLPKLGGS